MSEAEKIKIITVDDHVMVRLGMQQALQRQDDFNFLCAFDSGEDALEGLTELSPDIAVVDYRLPGIDGVETTARIRADFPDVQVLMLSAHDSSEDIGRAVDAGVRGYVTKNHDATLVFDAVRAIAAGKTYFPPDIERNLAKRSQRKTLSPREVEVLTFLAKGLSNKQIQSHLNISVYTVRNHLCTVFEKLGAEDRTHAVVIALREGLIELEKEG